MKGKMRRGCGGPCNHCGRTSSPCWRKGPVEKPVLCNACGARYLVKRSLEGYMPGQKQQRAGTRANVGPEVGGISSRSTVERRTLNSRSFSRPILGHQDPKKNEDPSRYIGLEGLMADAMSLSAGDIDVSVAPVFGAFCRGEHGKPSEEVKPCGRFERFVCRVCRALLHESGHLDCCWHTFVVPLQSRDFIDDRVVLLSPGFSVDGQEYLEGLAHIAASTLAMLRHSTHRLDGGLCYRQGSDVAQQDQPMLDRN